MNYRSNMSVTESFAHQISCATWYLLSCNSLTSVYHRKTWLIINMQILRPLVFLSNQRSHGKVGGSPTINKTVFAFVSHITNRHLHEKRRKGRPWPIEFTCDSIEVFCFSSFKMGVFSHSNQLCSGKTSEEDREVQVFISMIYDKPIYRTPS